MCVIAYFLLFSRQGADQAAALQFSFGQACRFQRHAPAVFRRRDRQKASVEARALRRAQLDSVFLEPGGPADLLVFALDKRLRIQVFGGSDLLSDRGGAQGGQQFRAQRDNGDAL
ncbi:hypothetical protein D9M69_707660 [compost metagenome]